jgi:type VI secretion system secreted protein Hcp
MAVDTFLKITEIPGDATIKGHIGDIEVESYAWGLANVSDGGTGGTDAPKPASLSDFSITKQMDKASPLLFAAACTGERFPEAILVVEEMGGAAGAKPVNAFLTIKMTHVAISSFQVSGSSDLPREAVSFNFARLDIAVRDSKGTVTKAESCNKGPL